MREAMARAEVGDDVFGEDPTVRQLEEAGSLARSPLLDQVAAVSVGLVEGMPLLDLDYEDDVGAEVDMNVVMTGKGLLVEVQGTAEGAPFTRAELDELLNLAEKGIGELLEEQRRAIG